MKSSVRASWNPLVNWCERAMKSHTGVAGKMFDTLAREGGASQFLQVAVVALRQPRPR
jgi:hypothetical protein